MNTEPAPCQPSDQIDAVYQKADDSWWVFRHGIDPQGQPLPYGRIVYFADSEREARSWMAHQAYSATP